MEPLVERDAELERLRALIDAASAGRGALAVVEGPPGIGKTRLLEAAREEARERELQVLAARGGDLERELPFGVARQLFERRLRRAEPATRAAWLEGPAGIGGKAVLAGDRAEPSAPADAHAALHGLYWLTSNICDEAPALLVVDDAHWSDPPSLRFLHYLARRIDDLRAVLLVSMRPADPEASEEPAARIRDEPATTMIRPAPLTASAVEPLVRRRLGNGAAPEFCDACHRASGGNPFLVGELIASLADDGVKPTVDAAERVASLVPDAVGRHVFSRLRRLPEEALTLARAVAVLGEGVELELAARLAGLAQAEAAAAADALIAAQLVVAAPQLGFVHPLLREAVSAELAAAELAREHARAAALLHEAGGSQDQVAAQLVAAPPLGEPWAVEVLRAAAADALRRGAPESSIAYLRRGLEEVVDRGCEAELRIELATAELTSGSPDRAASELERVLEADGEAIATVAPLLHVARWGAGKVSAAVEIADRATSRLAERDPEAALRLELSAALAILEHEGFAAASSRLERIAERADETEAPLRLLAGSLIDLANLAPSERPVARVEAAAARFEGIATPLDLQPFAYLIVALHALERYDVALRLLERTLSEARARGDAATLLVALGWRAWNAFHRGELGESRADCELAIAVGEDAYLHMHERVAADILMGVAREADPHGELARWADLPLERGGVGREAGQLAYRGGLRLAQGRHEEALADLSEAAAGYDRIGMLSLSASDVRPQLVLAHKTLGEDALAAEVARECLERADRVGTPRLRGVGLRCVALTAPVDRRLGLLRESVAVLEATEARLELAHSLCDLGAALRRRGERRACREPLGRARELAHACGAPPLEERAHQELLASGARPRRIATSGVDSLTPSERRVAELAAEGITNREIAQALFLSLRTVEMHLTRAYRKLEVESRSELPRALRADAGAG